MATHTLIMIHGMGEGTSEKEYDQLANGILANVADPHKYDFVRVEWQSVTYAAEKTIFDECFPDFDLIRSIQYVEPARYFMTYFVGDIIAYTAEPANKNGIRRKVWEQIRKPCKSGRYSILAHSLGSIIAFDYLYKLFKKNTLLPPGKEKEPDPEKLNPYKNNFRHLFTFGSLIGLFMLRQGKLWFGDKPFSKIVNPVSKEHSWLNFYDKQDAAAYPLAPLFALNPQNKTTSIKDIQVDTGDLIVDSHTHYWANKQMAKKIAEVLEAETDS